MDKTNARSEPHSVYTGDFYEKRRARTLHSARRVLQIVMDQFPVQSVIDVGCGTGTWLDVARTLGATYVKGIEGPWLDLAQRDADDIKIVTQDLEDPIFDNRRYDLAICLEVAEHLSPGRGASLIDDLCRLSDRVLFGAAIPSQGGPGHVNEQWQSHWAEHFSRHGYVPLDIVRPRIWTDGKIRFWYKQNTLLYCKAEAARGVDAFNGLPTLDVVHPGLFERKVRKYTEKIKELKAAKRAKT